MSDTSAAETSESLTIAVEDVDGNVSADQPNSFTSSNDTPETLSKNGNKRKGRTSGGGCGGGASRKRPRVEQLILKNSPFEGTESNAELRQERAEMFPERSGITFESKGKVEVKWSGKNGTENWFPARFIAFDGNSGQVQVHFNNWSSRYDEWIDSTSDRLRPPTEPSESETPEPDRKSVNVYTLNLRLELIFFLFSAKL